MASTTTQASTDTDLDHTSFAVHNALEWARRFRAELGATPIGGEILADFRYLLLYVGTRAEGTRVELLEPVGQGGFLARHLTKRGEGPHHITFTVSDLRDAVARVRALGSTVVGENYAHAPWREAFILPDSTHGVVIQLAQSDRSYPGAEELLTTQHRDTARFPSVSGAVEPLWWTSLWETAAGQPARLRTTHLASADMVFSRSLFEDVLGGTPHGDDECLQFSWPGGNVRVHTADKPGVTGMSSRRRTPVEMRIGSSELEGPG